MPSPVVVYSEGATHGGAEIALRQLLAALDPSLDVAVMGTDRAVVEWLAEVRPGTRTVVVPAIRTKRDLARLVVVRAAIAAERPAVFHVNLAAVDGAKFAVLAALSVPGVPVVAWVHSPIVSGGRLSRLAAGLSSWFLAAHVAVGSGLAADLGRLPLGRRGRVRHIPVGLPATSSAPVVLDLPHPVVGSVARLVAGKRLDLLIDAFAALPDGSLVVVGDGPERDRLLARAAALGVSARVHLVGWQEDVAGWLAAFDVFVLSSDAEGVPLTVLEAMRAGVAVVATDVGSVGDAVVPGETGVLVPPGDVGALAAALATLLSHDDERRRLTAGASRLVAERYAAEAMATQFQALYADVGGRVSGRRGARRRPAAS